MVNAVNLSAFSILLVSVHDALDGSYSVTWIWQGLCSLKKFCLHGLRQNPFVTDDLNI